MSVRRIIFIANQAYPLDNSGGGGVVVYRHLKRLEDVGYKILIVNTLTNSLKKSVFQEINLKRKWWYPPLRRETPHLTNLRVFFDYTRLKWKINLRKEDIIITVLGEYINLVALRLAKSIKLKIFSFYHDDVLFSKYASEGFLSDSHIDKIIRSNNCFFAVSQQMVDLLKAKGANDVHLLYPIPNNGDAISIKANWKDAYSEKVCLGFSGLLFDDFHSDILSKIAVSLKIAKSELHLFSTDLNSQLTQTLSKSFENVLLHNAAPTISELFENFVNHTSAILVFYSFKRDVEVRMFTSFPSKLLEYMSVGLPIMIVAPPESTLGIWAQNNKWPLYVSVEDRYVIASKLEELKNQEFWEKCRKRCTEMSKTSFNADQIHRQLCQYLGVDFSKL